MPKALVARSVEIDVNFEYSRFPANSTRAVAIGIGDDAAITRVLSLAVVNRR